MNDFQIDARRWRFLGNPDRYIEQGSGDLQVEPLRRQFNTASEILARLADGRGVILADDVGLGKTTVGALVAWVLACQGKRVRIYAPNDILRRRWAEELERHVPMLQKRGGDYKDVHTKRIKQGIVARLDAGQIQVATHHTLIKLKEDKESKRHAKPDNGSKAPSGAPDCDLMIIDEAHRAKGEGSAFNEALHKLGSRAKRKLILTATPFSIRLAELEQLLQFVGATEFKAVTHYAADLKRLYTLGNGHDVAAESKRLVDAAKAAIDQLQLSLIRHGIDDLSEAERKHFGDVAATPWDIATPPASSEDIQLLLRMDRLLQIAPARRGARRNDPRFHIGWQHVETEVKRVAERCTDRGNQIALRHIEEAQRALTARRTTAHPKVAAVSDAIRPVLDAGEKVLVFCHHRATAAELLAALERSSKAKDVVQGGPPEFVWRAAWKQLSEDEKWKQLGLRHDDTDLIKKRERNKNLIRPILDWFCTPGLRAQISSWIDDPASSAEALAKQLSDIRPRNAKEGTPSILQSATSLVKVLLDEQSTSTRKLLTNISSGARTFAGTASHLPGRLDEGFRVMGSWSHDGHSDAPATLYTRTPDVVIALFNSPFGPDVLVATDRLSEGVDLHRWCRHLIHYELDPSPVRTLQRNGRVRRVGSWAAISKQPLKYAYPTFGGTRDEKAVAIMRQRIDAFGMLLGGVPSLDADEDVGDPSFANAVLRHAGRKLKELNRRLVVS
ncbi:helicase-like protein [Acidovorax sp. 93]|uniref:SNF2-related protein n=1 Tax=Acidovorax sp. 93 TaxID=2135632 RepID=UPI000EB5DD77|nr:SNF2-related protein [Acidovorax sp. 93]RKR26775.1 helicase-like protein [Acidovorax sp. 93]